MQIVTGFVSLLSEMVPSVSLKRIESMLLVLKKDSARNRIMASAHCWRS